MLLLLLVAKIHCLYYVHVQLTEEEISAGYTVNYQIDDGTESGTIDGDNPTYRYSQDNEFAFRFQVANSNDPDCSQGWNNLGSNIVQQGDDVSDTPTDFPEELLASYCPSLIKNWYYKFDLTGVDQKYSFSYEMTLSDGTKKNGEVERNDEDEHELSDTQEFTVKFYVEANDGSCPKKLVYTDPTNDEFDSEAFFPVHKPLSQKVIDLVCSCTVQDCLKCGYQEEEMTPGKCEICTSGDPSADGLCGSGSGDECGIANCKQCSADHKQCEECEPNYEKDGEGGCKPVSTDECEIANCKQCSADHKQCEECEPNYEKDGEGGCKPVSTEAKCSVKEDPGQYDCAECNADKTLCVKCVNSIDYVPDAEGGCTLKCVPGKFNCNKCNEKETECTECSVEGLIINEALCLCKGEYEFINGKCEKELDILQIPETKTDDLSKDCSHKDNNIQTIDTSKQKDPDNTLTYILKPEDDAEQINVINKANLNLKISIPLGKEITLIPESDDTHLSVVCEGQNTLYVKNIANTIFYLDGSLTIDTVKDDSNSPKDITINKVILSGNYPNINPSKDLIINELQIFKYSRLLTTQKEHNITIKNLKVEQGGEISFSSEKNNFQVQSAEVGVSSTITLNNAFNDCDFTLYYNRPQDPIILKTPFQITDFSSLPKSYTIKNKDAGSYLEDTEFIVVSSIIKNGQEEKVKEVCEKLENALNPSDSFKSATCRYGTLFHNDVMLVASSKEKESNKKKGLSAGAIAGIVIGCVAAVAIIVVVVVVLVMKKKKVGRASSSSP